MPSPPKPPSSRPLKPAKEGQPSKPPSTRKKASNARISAACEACKKRKTKCSGGPAPCQLCETLGTECVIDLSLDMRRRAAFQRTIDESKNHQHALNLLLDCIREEPSARLEGLFEYIRGGATNQDIAIAVQQHLSRTEDEDADADGDETMVHLLDGVDGHDSYMEDSKPARSPAETSIADSMLSESDKGKAADLGPSTVSGLLYQLKNTSQPQGEALLRRFLASRAREKVILPPFSPARKYPWEGAGPGINPPSVADRASWHPVLHVRTQSSRMDERPQFAHLGSPRRFSEGGPNADDPQSFVSSSPSPVQVSANPSSRQSEITTDASMNTSTAASSPANPNPYFELITNPSGPPRPSEWDLCIAQDDQVTRLRIPRHLVIPLVIADDSPMSRTYTDYLSGARRMLDGGVPAEHVLGYTERVTVDLFFRPRQANDRFDCASWACEVIRSYDTDIFVRLATACLLTHMMRWLLVPSLDNYGRIPDMMKPTPTQCMIPHIGAIETIPLPPVRDAAINKLRDWLTPLIDAKWSVNWPHSVDMAVERDAVSGATVLTQRFHDHVTIYDNWSVASQFLSAFPEVAGRVRIHEDG